MHPIKVAAFYVRFAVLLNHLWCGTHEFDQAEGAGQFVRRCIDENDGLRSGSGRMLGTV